MIWSGFRKWSFYLENWDSGHPNHGGGWGGGSSNRRNKKNFWFKLYFSLVPTLIYSKKPYCNIDTCVHILSCFSDLNQFQNCKNLKHFRPDKIQFLFWEIFRLNLIYFRPFSKLETFWRIKLQTQSKTNAFCQRFKKDKTNFYN